MYCMNLCHSKVVWKYYTGLFHFVGILAFGSSFCQLPGAHTEGNPLGCSFLVTKCMLEGVSGRTKGAMDLMLCS